MRLPRAERGLDLHALLAALRERGAGTVLLEGGPTLAGSFLAEDLIDRVVGYIAPVLLGGGGLSSSAVQAPRPSTWPAGSSWSRSAVSVRYIAPVLLGGGGLSSPGGPGAPSIDLARRLQLAERAEEGLVGFGEGPSA